MLEEVELLVGRGRPEVVALVGEGLLLTLALFVDYREAGLLPERRIREHQVVPIVGLAHKGVFHDHRRVFLLGNLAGADAVEVQVHGAEPGGIVDDLPALERVFAERLLLVAGEVVVLCDVVLGGEEEAAGPDGGVGDRLGRLRVDGLHRCLDERARGEVLSSTALRVLCVFLQEGPRRCHLSHPRPVPSRSRRQCIQ